MYCIITIIAACSNLSPIVISLNMFFSLDGGGGRRVGKWVGKREVAFEILI
jgi:hypothetical protein